MRGPILALAALAAAATLARAADEYCIPLHSRSFMFTYQVEVPAAPPDGGPLNLWIPLPAADANQTVEVATGDLPVKSDPLGNRFVFIEGAKAPLSVSVKA